MSSTLAAPPSVDPRLRPGAYITDGADLYCVERSAFTPTSLRPNILVVEDCRTNTVLELDVDRVATTCTLVGRAPSP
jgi:hypothetical protein